jgi:hypothetical protein
LPFKLKSAVSDRPEKFLEKLLEEPLLDESLSLRSCIEWSEAKEGTGLVMFRKQIRSGHEITLSKG